MTGRGRPSTGVRVDIRIPATRLDDIDVWARTAGITRAAMVRHLLQHGMDTVTDDELAEWTKGSGA